LLKNDDRAAVEEAPQLEERDVVQAVGTGCGRGKRRRNHSTISAFPVM
jgi:electron transfer flavoprotein alpha/beta subunit